MSFEIKKTKNAKTINQTNVIAGNITRYAAPEKTRSFGLAISPTEAG